jgi:hypothetical protein
MDRLRNDLRETMLESGVEEGWTPHALRGASASKCINLGLDTERVLSHGRWANMATLKKSYFRPDFFCESSSDNLHLPIWRALRLPVRRVDTVNMDILQ